MPTWESDDAGSLCADRSSPRALGVRVPARPAIGRPGLDTRQRLCVRVEERVHRGAVFRPEHVIAPVAVAAHRHRAVVGDVAGGLLEVGGQPAALQDLREHVRDPLGRDVRAAELRDRVVAVAKEHVLVEPARPLAFRAVERSGDAGINVGGELVEEEAPQGSGVARVAREQGALDGLRQVHEAEHRQVEVREVGLERGALCGGELFDGVLHGRASLAPDPEG
jgi:hypothetical protein